MPLPPPPRPSADTRTPGEIAAAHAVRAAAEALYDVMPDPETWRAIEPAVGAIVAAVVASGPVQRLEARIRALEDRIAGDTERTT